MPPAVHLPDAPILIASLTSIELDGYVTEYLTSVSNLLVDLHHCLLSRRERCAGIKFLSVARLETPEQARLLEEVVEEL